MDDLEGPSFDVGLPGIILTTDGRDLEDADADAV